MEFKLIADQHVDWLLLTLNQTNRCCGWLLNCLEPEDIFRLQLARLFCSQNLSQGAESTPSLSWSPQLSPFFCLNPLVASRTIFSPRPGSSEYKMTTSAVSFLSTLFFFGRLKGVGRVQPRCARFQTNVLSLRDSVVAFGPSGRPLWGGGEEMSNR